MRVSVLTASIPQRADMLAEAIASVKAQTHSDVEHLYAIDVDRQGAAPILNALLDEALGEWVMVLDDDDLLDPEHLETIIPHCTHADVVYSKPRVLGGEFVNYEQPFNEALLGQGYNCVSHTALMRTDMVRRIGGWESVKHFDLDLFLRLAKADATFAQVDAVTWTYRLHGDNWSRGGLL